MKHTKKFLAAALCSVGFASPAVLADVAAAAPGGCVSATAICLYDGKNYRGAFESIQCSRLNPVNGRERRIRFDRLQFRVSSLVNGCRRSIVVYGTNRHPARRIYAKQWKPDFGKLGIDNTTNYVYCN